MALAEPWPVSPAVRSAIKAAQGVLHVEEL
jgi:hypothetical protein